MSTTFTTGNSACDKLAKMSFEGNVTPANWFHTIIDNRGKPHLAAITLLADIVYWYRPILVRDELTGRITGYRKKFQADLLQKSYNDLSKSFGMSRSQIHRALDFLEDLGVIDRVFRNVEIMGQLVSNVMYIDLKADRLAELTYPIIDANSNDIGAGSLANDGKGDGVGASISASDNACTGTDTGIAESDNTAPTAGDDDNKGKDIGTIADDSTTSGSIDGNSPAGIPHHDFAPPSCQICHEGIANCGQAPIKKGKYTKNTADITAENTTEIIYEEEGSARARERENIADWIRGAVCYSDYSNTGFVAPSASDGEKEVSRMDYINGVQALIDISAKKSTVVGINPAHFVDTLRQIINEDGDLCGFLHALLIRFNARVKDKSQKPIANRRNYLQKFAYDYAPAYLDEILQGLD